MKKTLIIEIEVPEDIGVLPEEGTEEDDYPVEELVEFRKEYAGDLVQAVVDKIESYMKQSFESDFIDTLDDLGIEDWDYDDYKISIVTSQK